MQQKPSETPDNSSESKTPKTLSEIMKEWEESDGKKLVEKMMQDEDKETWAGREEAAPVAATLSVTGFIEWTVALDLPQIDNKEDRYAHEAALIAHLRKHNITHGGNWHQSVGVPVFSDGKVLMVSLRTWGGYIADAQGDTDPWAYCKWAWVY